MHITARLGNTLLRISRPFTTALLLAVVYGLLVYLDARTTGNINNGDSNNLANGARVAVDCLRDGIVTSCGAQPGGHSSVFPYPLLQYLPAGLLVLAGATEQTVVTLLAQLNFLAVVAMPIVAWFGFSRRLRPTALFTASVMASSLTYHSTAAFGEPLSALAILGFSASITQRRLAWAVAFGLLASVSKETLSPVLLLVLAASLLMPDQAARREVTTRLVERLLSLQVSLSMPPLTPSDSVLGVTRCISSMSSKLMEPVELLATSSVSSFRRVLGYFLSGLCGL